MFKKVSLMVLVLSFMFVSFGPNNVFAATSPTLVGSINYSVLGFTTVTNTGATTTTGEVGVSSGTSITGFDVPGGPGVAGGNNAIHVHSNDASAIAAQADNIVAFGALNTGANAGANCINPLTMLAGSAPDGTDLVGLTLGPGLYCSLGSFALSNGAGYDLTLTGAGPWVFKTASSTLITATGSSISVPNPTDACNVWWRVGSSATLGTSSDFKGNILALASVTLNTGATLYGRAMAQTGAVTLAGNTISGCAAPLVAPSLTLNKIVVGGSSLESAWTVTATGPMSLSGFGAIGSIDVVGDLAIGTYDLSESTNPSYYTSSLWSCVKNGGAAVDGSSISLTWDDVATCTITSTYHAPSGGGGTTYGCKDPSATNYNAFSSSNPALCVYASSTTTVTPVIIETPVIIPSLPKTGFPPKGENNSFFSFFISNFLNLFR